MWHRSSEIGGEPAGAGAAGNAVESGHSSNSNQGGQVASSRAPSVSSEQRPLDASRRPSVGGGLLGSRSRAHSLVDLSGDHFTYGELHGSFTNLSEHDYLNRGKGVYAQERERLRLPALVETGRYAGRSRVEHVGAGIHMHLLKRDFFISCLQVRFGVLALGMAAVYLFTFWFWGTIWYLLVRFKPGCVYGATTLAESWALAIVTQMTIGYGNSGPQQCWAAAFVITAQAISCTVILNAVVLGIIFAKVASPAHRAYSIYISDTAVIARRDGILKLVFRIADVRRTQVLEPRVRAWLYTWGEGRVTAEGEYIPVRCEPLDLAYIDGMLLLPLIIEHTIDERSPLCGHTHDSLTALDAEIVVTFEATTENGNMFYARQSYLAQEIHWGCTFVEIIQKPRAGEEEPAYKVDLDRFHDVRCPDMELCDDESDPRSRASQLVVNRAKRAVPYPILGENTLVLSDLLCVRPVEGEEGGKMELRCRVADTYPNQMLDITARMYLYRWRPEEWCRQHPDHPSFTMHQLECGYSTGADRLYLRLPYEVSHVIDATSPLASWLQPGGLSEDADSEIVVVLQGYLYQTSCNRMRQRTYRVGSHVRYGFQFAPAVRPPRESSDGKPRTRWSHFFDVEPVGWGESGRGRPTVHMHSSALNSPALRAYVQRRTSQAAPESHAQVRAQQDRNPHLNHALDKPLSRSLRWVPADPEAAQAAAMVRQHSLLGPAAAAAAAEAASSAREAAEAPAGRAAPWATTAGAAGAAAGAAGAAGVHPPWAAAAGEVPSGAGQSLSEEEAEEVGEEVSPEVGMDRYEALVARPSILSPETVAAAVQEAERQRQQQLEAGRPLAAQQEQRQHWAGQQGVGRGTALAGPSDLGTLSAGPSGAFERYGSTLTHLSGEPSGGSAASSGASSPPSMPGGPGPSPGHAQQQQQHPQQQPHSLLHEQLRRPSPPFQPQSDLLPSDFTVTSLVPMDRYAAMVASADEDAGSVLGDGSSGAYPPHQQQRATSAGVSFAVPAGDHDLAQCTQRDASWHRGRSLANLHAILEGDQQIEEQVSRPTSPAPRAA